MRRVSQLCLAVLVAVSFLSVWAGDASACGGKGLFRNRQSGGCCGTASTVAPPVAVPATPAPKDVPLPMPKAAPAPKAASEPVAQPAAVVNIYNNQPRTLFQPFAGRGVFIRGNSGCSNCR